MVSRRTAELHYIDLQVQELDDILKRNSSLKVDIGKGTDASLIDRVRLELGDVLNYYRRRSDSRYPYESLQEGPTCRDLVDSWVEVRKFFCFNKVVYLD